MKLFLFVIHIFITTSLCAFETNDPYYSLLWGKRTEEEYLIPKVCSKYKESKNYSCGSGVTSHEITEEEVPENYWLVYTSAHQFEGQDKKVCFKSKECFDIKEGDYLINGLYDIAIFKITIPRTIFNYRIPLLYSNVFPITKDDINPEKNRINNVINLQYIYANTHLESSQDQQYKQLRLANALDVTLFDRISIVGDITQSRQSHKGERTPFVPIRKSLKVNNLDSPITYVTDEGEKRRELLRNLHFSGNRISAAHLDPGVSGAPLIQMLPGDTRQSSLRGIYSAFNYRVSLSLFAATDQIEDLYIRFQAGERGHIKNFREQAVYHQYDPKTQSTFKVFDNGKISENPNYYGVKNASRSDFGEAFGSDFGEGQDQGNAFGADFGEGQDQSNAFGADFGEGQDQKNALGADFGEGQENNSKHFDRFRDIINYSKIKPGLIYNNKLTIGFKVKYSEWWWTNELNLYANTEGLHAIEEIVRNDAGTIEPILMDENINFHKLFLDKFGHKKVKRTKCYTRDDLCFSMKFKEGDPHIEMEFFNFPNKEPIGKILIDPKGKITLIYEETQKTTDFFQPWITLAKEDYKLQLDIRNLFFIDTMNIMSTKTQDQIIRNRTNKIFGREPLFGDQNHYRENPIEMLKKHNTPVLIISKTPIKSKVGPKPKHLKFR